MSRLLLCMLLFLTSLASHAHAEGAARSEYAIKSLLLFKLPQFVYQPNVVSTQTLGVCLLGSNPFGSALEKLAQKPLDGRTVAYRWLANVGEAMGCDFLFISRSEAGNLDGIFRRLSGRAMVTVSDIDGFARAGGMVELATGGEGAVVSILINRKVAQKQNIEFNAQLLRLAKVVEP